MLRCDCSVTALSRKGVCDLRGGGSTGFFFFWDQAWMVMGLGSLVVLKVVERFIAL